jgi:hypothetical protein
MSSAFLNCSKNPLNFEVQYVSIELRTSLFKKRLLCGTIGNP